MAANDAGDDKTGGRHPSDADLDARRRALDVKLGAVERTRSGDASQGQGAAPEPSAMVKLFRFSADFVSGVLAGALIGWLIDHFAGTRPWGLIVFLLLGFVTGVYNLVKAAQRDHQERSGDGPSP